MTRPLPAAVVSGQPVTRVDGRLKVTGKALYAADNPAPDLVYAALVCSTIARGTVLYLLLKTGRCHRLNLEGGGK